jgi:hypothetical protein
MTTEHSTILNKVWPIYPQLRYCCSHLLAGAILVDGVKAILLNTIELYSRDSLSDAHYERRCRTQDIHYGSLTLSLASGNVRSHFLFQQTW